MDDPAQARAYAQADFSDANSLFIETFSTQFGDREPRRVIDLGCGPADIPVRFVRRYPGAQVTAVDGSPAMRALARARIEADGLSDQIKIVHWCLGEPRPPSVAGYFDAILSNSLLHHLRDPVVMWGAIETLAKPGAAILVMDLIRPATERAACAIVEKYSSADPEILRNDFYNSLLAAYRVDEIRTQLAGTLLSSFKVERISDRHLAVFGGFPAGT